MRGVLTSNSQFASALSRGQRRYEPLTSRGSERTRIGADSGVEILSDLKRKYPTYLKLDFQSIKIVHRDGVSYLESIRYRHAGLRDEVVERTDLAFISVGIGRGEMFPASRSPQDNARLFVHELDEVSMIHCTDLFTHDACEEIERNYRTVIKFAG